MEKKTKRDCRENIRSIAKLNSAANYYEYDCMIIVVKNLVYIDFCDFRFGKR